MDGLVESGGVWDGVRAAGGRLELRVSADERAEAGGGGGDGGGQQGLAGARVDSGGGGSVIDLAASSVECAEGADELKENEQVVEQEAPRGRTAGTTEWLMLVSGSGGGVWGWVDGPAAANRAMLALPGS